jgi:hypothetical protein
VQEDMYATPGAGFGIRIAGKAFGLAIHLY